MEQTTLTSRTITVDARRLQTWTAGFEQRHGAATVAVTAAGLTLRGADGATAALTPPFAWPQNAVPDAATRAGDPARPPVAEPLGHDPVLVAGLAAWVLRPRRVAAVLARRGGYGCAVLGIDGVEASKVGTRYVQGRTAAGGWSQQRFARRRENQTEDLVRACADVAARLLVSGPFAGSPAAVARGGASHPSFDGLLTGGDRRLVERVLADSRLRHLVALPRAAHLALGDPRSDVVRSLPDRLRGVTVTLTEPADDLPPA